MVLCTWRPSELHCSVHTGPTSDFQSNRTTQNKAAIFPTALSYLQKCEKLQTATGKKKDDKTPYLKNLWLYWSETTSLLYCCMKERQVPTLWLHCLHKRLVENKPHDGLKRSQSSSHSHFLRRQPADFNLRRKLSIPMSSLSVFHQFVRFGVKTENRKRQHRLERNIAGRRLCVSDKRERCEGNRSAWVHSVSSCCMNAA